MKLIRRIGSFAAVLAGLAAALLAFGAAPAFATVGPPMPEPGGTSVTPTPVQVHTVVVGGMPGWQITLIALAAALLAATAAVLTDRARAARRRAITATA